MQLNEYPCVAEPTVRCGVSRFKGRIALVVIYREEGADIFLDYLSDQSKSMSVLYRTQIS